MGAPLHYAIRKVQNVRVLVNVVKILLKYGADINLENGKRETPLIVACLVKSDIVPYLVNCGASIDALSEEKRSPLMHSVHSGNIRAIKFLLDKGADINCIHNGETPLALAARRGYKTSMEILLERGADVKKCSDKLIRGACISKKDGILERIVELIGTETKLKNDFTPLILCLYVKLFEQAKKLIELGANVNAKSNKGSAPLHYAISCENVEIVNELLKRGANVDEMNANEIYPLHLAIRRKNLEIFNLLIEAGADVNIYGEKSDCPLTVACVAKQFEMIEILLKRGADPEKTMRIISGRYNPIDLLKVFAKHCDKMLFATFFRPRVTFEKANGLDNTASRYMFDRVLGRPE